MNAHQVLEKLMVEFIKNIKVEPDVAMFGKTLGNELCNYSCCW